MSIAFPKPNEAVLARRDEILTGLARLVAPEAPGRQTRRGGVVGSGPFRPSSPDNRSQRHPRRKSKLSETKPCHARSSSGAGLVALSP
jgi:hypothetical protein